MASDDAGWRQLHPGSVLVNLIPRLWGVVRAFWPLALAIVYGTTQGGGLELLDVVLLLTFFGAGASGTVIHWLTLRYRVAEGRLEVKSGLFNRQVRVIAPERIQNLEMTRNVFHRLAGLVELRIETASGTEVEGLLSALSVAEAEALIAELGRARPATASPEDEPVVVENGTLDLVRYGATAARLGASAVLVGLASEWLQFSDPDEVMEVGAVLGTLGAVALLLAALSGAFVLGVGSAVMRHHGFRLVRRGAALVASEGLFTTRQVELPLGKVQLVTVSEPLLRRLLGFGSVHIETAAARSEQGGVAHAEAMAPYVDADRFAEVVAAALPQLDVDFAALELRPPHPRALVRAVAVAALRGAVVGGLATWWFGPYGAAAFLFIPVGVLGAVLDHRFQGWLVTDQVVLTRSGWWSRATQVVDRHKLQSLQVSQGPFLRNYGLAVLRVRVAGSSVELPVLDWDQALAIQRELLDGTAAPST